MEGVNILTQTMIMETPIWYDILIFMIVVAVIALIMLSMHLCDYKGATLICFLGAIGCVIAFLVLIIIDFKEPVGRYKYEVTISEEVSMVEIHERYDVIEQRGQIWVLEDKKVEE